jgi:hypothetical protein
MNKTCKNQSEIDEFLPSLETVLLMTTQYFDALDYSVNPVKTFFYTFYGVFMPDLS